MEEKEKPEEMVFITNILIIAIAIALIIASLGFTWGIMNDKFKATSNITCSDLECPSCNLTCEPCPDCVCETSCPNMTVKPIVYERNFTYYYNYTNSTG